LAQSAAPRTALVLDGVDVESKTPLSSFRKAIGAPIHVERIDRLCDAGHNNRTRARTHLSLNKDAPVPQAVRAIGRILPTPILGGITPLV
jgi:hypothetical protein